MHCNNTPAALHSSIAVLPFGPIRAGGLDTSRLKPRTKMNDKQQQSMLQHVTLVNHCQLAYQLRQRQIDR
jgi:hypothetical protein